MRGRISNRIENKSGAKNGNRDQIDLIIGHLLTAKMEFQLLKSLQASLELTNQISSTCTSLSNPGMELKFQMEEVGMVKKDL